MVCHIRIGKLSWCEAPYSKRIDLALVARQDGVTLACSHVNKESAEKMVRFLHQYGVEAARIVTGICTR